MCVCACVRVCVRMYKPTFANPVACNWNHFSFLVFDKSDQKDLRIKFMKLDKALDCLKVGAFEFSLHLESNKSTC